MLLLLCYSLFLVNLNWSTRLPHKQAARGEMIAPLPFLLQLVGVVQPNKRGRFSGRLTGDKL